MALYASSFHHPSSWEKAAAERTISDLSERLQDISADKKALEFELLRLTCEEEMYSAELHANRSILSTSRRIPFEVLSEIFIYYVHSDPTHICRLMLVCKAWYNVAINQKQLWTNITLRGPFTESYTDEQLYFVRACIERSAPRLINIDLESTEHTISKTTTCEMPTGAPMEGHKLKHSRRDCTTCRSEAKNMVRICETLAGGSKGTLTSRWGSLRLIWPGALGLTEKQLSTLLSRSTPNLQHLTICGPPGLERIKFTLPSNLDHLKSFEASNICWHEGLAGNIPSLEEMTVRVGTGDRFWGDPDEVGPRFLMKFRCLKILSLTSDEHGRYHPPATIQGTNTVLLPQVHTLTLIGSHSPEMLGSLHLPSLYRLVVEKNKKQSSNFRDLPKISFGSTALTVLDLNFSFDIDCLNITESLSETLHVHTSIQTVRIDAGWHDMIVDDFLKGGDQLLRFVLLETMNGDSQRLLEIREASQDQLSPSSGVGTSASEGQTFFIPTPAMPPMVAQPTPPPLAVGMPFSPTSTTPLTPSMLQAFANVGVIYQFPLPTVQHQYWASV